MKVYIKFLSVFLASFLLFSCGKEEFLSESPVTADESSSEMFLLEELSQDEKKAKRQEVYEAILLALTSQKAKDNFSLAFQKIEALKESRETLCPKDAELTALYSEAKNLASKEEKKTFFESKKEEFKSLKLKVHAEKIDCMLLNKEEFSSFFYEVKMMKMACGLKFGKHYHHKKSQMKKGYYKKYKKEKRYFKLASFEKLDPSESEKITKLAEELEEKLKGSSCDKFLAQ